MTRTNISREALDARRRVLEKYPAVDAAYVLGSLGSGAMGRLRPDSDIDIALLLAHE